MSIPDLSKYESFWESSKDIPLDKFEALFSSENKTPYVRELSFDPEKAKYFEKFMHNHERTGRHHWYTPPDYSLSGSQLEAFKKDGFVAKATKDGDHWGAVYHRLHNNDLPVLITTDSILHAFHMSYDALLQDIETDYCIPTLKQILESMRAEITNSVSKFPSGPFHQNLKDADFFVTVALNLLTGEKHYRPGSAEDPTLQKDSLPPAKETYWRRDVPLGPQPFISTVLGGDDAVEQALKLSQSAQGVLPCELFGRARKIDFSLMKPRGHYNKTEVLRLYFRAMSWLGTVDMIVAGEDVPVRELGAAVVLHMLLTSNKAVADSFQQLNNIIEVFVGSPNSMDFKQLDQLLNSIFKLKDYAELNSDGALEALQKKIMESEFGVKKYNKTANRSFKMLGARFTLDNWAASKFVVPNVRNVRTRISSVDIAFSVLGNEDAASVLLDRIRDGKPKDTFRDGVEYQANLVATKQTIDDLPAETWETSIYQHWLSTLRKLSLPMDERFPQAMRTKAYAMKKMSTQLGSWAQLRHDTILYVEQACFSGCECEYPHGYIEPFVEFWKSLEKLCQTTGKALEGLGIDEKDTNKIRRKVEFFTRFSDIVHTLLEISQKELDQQPLSSKEIEFIKNTVEVVSMGSGGDVMWRGWYPKLFYKWGDVETPDLIACDVFSSYPDDITGEPGCVLHQALGNPRLMYMAIDNGNDVAVYAGPIFDHYEFTLPGQQRKSDEEWKSDVKKGDTPAPPEWASYIVS